MQLGGMGQGLGAEALRAPIVTRRLVLRPPVAADLVAISRLINDPVIAQNTTLIRYPYPVISGRQWIASAHAAAAASFHIPFMMTLRSNPRLIAGSIGISFDGSQITTIGYWIAKPYRRRGFTAEAARAVIHLAFAQTDAPAVAASARTSNVASQRVLRGAGMRRVGYGRINSAQLGRYVPSVIYRLDRGAWEQTWVSPHARA
jgi:RimJ/RimL family protein N-acetyltransferase